MARIGIIAPRWLPTFGGGQQYMHALILELLARGEDVRVFTGTPEKRGFDNGAVKATRLDQGADIEWASWLGPDNFTPINVTRLSHHYKLIDEAIKWVQKNEIEIAIVAQPFQSVVALHAREIYSGLKALGLKVGIFNFDLPIQINNLLINKYLESNDWERAASVAEQEIQKVIERSHPIEGLLHIGSPVFFSPDFIISCSDWSGRFINPVGKCRQITVHPLLPTEDDSKEDQVEILDRADVLMVNPQGRKGPENMKELLFAADDRTTFRVLRGGWGSAFETFLPMISDCQAFSNGRISMVEYVHDMRSAFRASSAFFFPSLTEGYGMTAVEAIYFGVPVVSSNYPAIIEGVGGAAKTLCPYRVTGEQWFSAISEVLRDRDYWLERGKERILQLRERQEIEVSALIKFLNSMIEA